MDYTETLYGGIMAVVVVGNGEMYAQCCARRWTGLMGDGMVGGER
jgi:hypothetical protein